jgi:hypothetical protein
MLVLAMNNIYTRQKLNAHSAQRFGAKNGFAPNPHEQ